MCATCLANGLHGIKPQTWWVSAVKDATAGIIHLTNSLRDYSRLAPRDFLATQNQPIKCIRVAFCGVLAGTCFRGNSTYLFSTTGKVEDASLAGV